LSPQPDLKDEKGAPTQCDHEGDPNPADCPVGQHSLGCGELELAAVGFARFGAAPVANVREDAPPKAQLASIGHAYVTFARQNQGLFVLMFRSERLEFSRPALRAAAATAFGVLAHAAGGQPQVRSDARLTLSQTAKIRPHGRGCTALQCLCSITD
jgi:hypothetical protein